MKNKILKMPRFYHDMVINGNASKLSLNPNHSFARKSLFLNYRFDCNKVLNSFNELLKELKTHLENKNDTYNVNTVEVTNSVMDNHRKKYHVKRETLNIDHLVSKIKKLHINQKETAQDFYLVPMKINTTRYVKITDENYINTIVNTAVIAQKEINKLNMTESYEKYLEDYFIRYTEKPIAINDLYSKIYSKFDEETRNTVSYYKRSISSKKLEILEWEPEKKLSISQHRYVENLMSYKPEEHVQRELNKKICHLNTCTAVCNAIKEQDKNTPMHKMTSYVVNGVIKHYTE